MKEKQEKNLMKNKELKCNFKDCNFNARIKGYCINHYQMKWRKK